MTAAPPKSAGEMMSDLLGNVGSLVRNEADLARSEIAESLNSAGAALVAMALALVLAIGGLNMLAAALVIVLVRLGLSPDWASVAIGGGLLAVALAIFVPARSALHRIGFVPARAARHLSRDAAAIKESFHEK